jgi:NAD(P)-dependent dehydrogenase (short-subunit alcohol dehydrogenase family)
LLAGRSSGPGKIIKVCSLQAELARPGIAPYAASEGGLKMLTRSMCADRGLSGTVCTRQSLRSARLGAARLI